MNRIFFFIALLSILFISACGDSQSTATDSSTSTNNDQEKTYGTVNLTTFRYLSQDQEIVAAFEKQYRLKVNVEVVSPATIVRRAQEGQLTGDVVITPTLEDIVRLKNFDQLQPFYIDAFSKGNVDDGYMDNAGYYAGLSRWTMAAIYNPKKVAIGEVSTYLNLAKLPGRGIRVGMAHPDSSGLAATVAGISRIVNNTGAAVWTKILYEGLTGSMHGNDYDVMDRLQAGEIDVAFVSSGAAVRWFLNGDPEHFELSNSFRFKYPKTETDDVNFFNMTSIGMVKNAANRPQALQFIEHLYTKENQEKFGAAVFEYPIEAFSVSDEYLGTIRDRPGRRVSATQMEEKIPFAWEVINQLGR